MRRLSLVALAAGAMLAIELTTNPATADGGSLSQFPSGNTDVCEHLVIDRPFVRFAEANLSMDAHAELILNDFKINWDEAKGNVLLEGKYFGRNDKNAFLAVKTVSKFLERLGIPQSSLWEKTSSSKSPMDGAPIAIVYVYNTLVGALCYQDRVNKVSRWIERYCIDAFSTENASACRSALKSIKKFP